MSVVLDLELAVAGSSAVAQGRHSVHLFRSHSLHLAAAAVYVAAVVHVAVAELAAVLAPVVVVVVVVVVMVADHLLAGH